jgi:hypothetical protein
MHRITRRVPRWTSLAAGDPGRTPNSTTRRTVTAHDREQLIDENLDERIHNDLMAGYTVNLSARYPDPGELHKGARLLITGLLLVLVALSIPMALWLHHAVVTAF